MKIPVVSSLLTTSLLTVGASLLATSAMAAPPEPPLGFGPLQVGMSLEELRAATPGVEWSASNLLKYSGRPTEFRADTVPVADRAFTARIAARHHGAYSLSLEHVYAAPDADHCEQTARAIFAVIEPQTGPMHPPGTMISGEEAEAIGARSTVKLSQVLSMANYKPISRAKLKGKQPARRWLRATTSRRDVSSSRLVVFEDETAGQNKASFSMDYEQEAANESCRIRLEAARSPSFPPLQTLAFNTVPAAQSPSISRRHFELSRLAISVTLPDSGIELNVRCKVDRDSGRTRDCSPTAPGTPIPGLVASPPVNATSANPPVVVGIGTPATGGLEAPRPGNGSLAASTVRVPPPPPPLTPDALASKARNTATRLARAYQFDMSQLAGLDRDDPQPVLVDIPVRMTPADIRELTATDRAVPLTQAGIRWATRAPAHVLEQLYPKRALRREEQTNVVLVCEVQDDLSAVCAPAAQSPRPSPDFEWAALEILTYYRAEPKSAAGTPSAGSLFLQNLQFKLQ